MLFPQVSNFLLIALAAQTPGAGEASVGEAHALGFAYDLCRNRLDWMLLNLELHVINFFQLVEKPGIDAGHLRDLFDGVALTDRITEIRKPLRMRRDKSLCKNFRLDFFATNTLAGIERAHAFHQSFFEGA